MSGLVGWVDFGRDLETRAEVVHAMTETMRHRGPDGKGVWISRDAALGHRRLATSQTDQSEQPAVAEVGDGTVALAYDGHVDNLPRLRRELEARGARLTTGTDTEALLQAYLLWGVDFVDHLDGIFAIALWDGRAHRLLLCRDRMGVKPLYHFEYPGGVLFASEPKGIMANPLFEARLNFEALPILLQPRLTLPGETPLAGLREVPPAHVVSLTPDGSSVRRYWRLTSESHHDSFADTAHRVRELLEDVVRRQLPDAGPCAAMLSGGVDSTSVAALAAPALRESGRALDTFCVEFEGDGAHFVSTELRPDVDGPYAALAAEFIGTTHTAVVARTSDLVDAIPATRGARDLPGWGQFDASMHLLFGHLRRVSPVALSGEAADEFFGGYPYLFKPELIRRDHFPWLGDGPKLSDYLAPDLKAAVDPEIDERSRYARLLAEVPRLEGEDPVNARMREVLFLGMSGPLSVVLDRKERMSATHGLEVRLPFCDHRLVQYAWNIPWSMKSAGGLKGLLKAAMADVLPPSTLNRQKSAYPHVHDPEHDRDLLRTARWIANDSASPLAGMFDSPRLNGLIDQVAADRLRSVLPGGASGPQMFVQLVEMSRWVEDYHVSLR